MSKEYSYLFERIPDSVLRAISIGCNLGDAAYAQVTRSDPSMFGSKFMKGTRTRLHDKAIHTYLHDRASHERAIQVSSKHVGFGDYIAIISGESFGIIPSRVTTIGNLPGWAKYKLKACESNPDADVDALQMNLFTPPTAKGFDYVQFFVTTYFNGMNTIATLVLPDKMFGSILARRPIMSVIATDEEIQYQERIMPKLISEVKEENEQNQVSF